MKTTWNYKLLQFLTNKKEDGGFTLIELLVVIIIIGILSAIALPAFLNQANRARQSEAVTYVGSVNRGQQAYFLEAATFSDNINRLGLGIAAETQNYFYAIDATDDPRRQATIMAKPATPGDLGTFNDDSPLLGYMGGATVALLSTGDSTSEPSTVAIVCRSNEAPVNGLDEDDFVEIAAPAENADAGTMPACPDPFVPIR